ncbi:MAG TPA: bifunctional ADP-dependent NAD(P)H-hydrate dehydratase/NAD(P)H-hydrate epimerase, partial [Blastocatellia bacterium]|nr:bifunctional ADP-dependent NAD(P)H-hydrate dehydratase/NAD(P)H-hydrate epimerase [Blastocatellia bacterium]
MQKVITAAEMREVDRLTTEKYGIPSIILMENAAQAAARALIGEFGGNIRGKTAVILCGSGNNGGDGAALARILWTLGANCSVFLVGNLAKTKGDAFTNFNAVKTISEAKKNSDARENFLHFSEIPYDAIDE